MACNSYGGSFMGMRPAAKTQPEEKKVLKSIPVNKKAPVKVIFSLAEARSINLPEIQGDRYFICTIIFDNNDVKNSLEKSNHNSQAVLGQFLHSGYTVSFNEDVVLKVPEKSSFARCYLSCVTVTEGDGKRNMKLEGLGYTDPFSLQECKVYAYANCKLNTAVGAENTGAVLKLCVKCVDQTHPSVTKKSEEFHILEVIKKKYEV